MDSTDEDRPYGRPGNPRSHLERENEELARGVLDLTRRLTIAEQRTKHAEELAERSMANASLWRRAGLERERWRAAYFALSAEHGKALGDGGAEEGHVLPLAYFLAGEEPGARWGLTELGQQAVDEGRAKGPEWTLLLSPDPREVLSIEVRRGSRQETTYRMAGYVTAEEPDFQGGHFLGLLEAFGEVARAQDEAMGRAMAALEKLFLYGCQEKAAQWLERTQARVASLLNAMEERPAREDLDAVDREHQAIEEAFGKWIKPRDCNASPDPVAVKRAWENRPGAPPYDLAAVCARCSRTYGDHILPLGPECDGFMAEAPKTAGLLFLCVACMEKKPLGERAPSTMPLCQDCWRKDP